MSDKGDADNLFNMIVNCFVSTPCVIKTPENWASYAAALRLKFNDSQNDSKSPGAPSMKPSVTVGKKMPIACHLR